MIIGILKCTEENLIAMVPQVVLKLIISKYSVFIETNAGENSGYSNELYRKSGAEIVSRNDVVNLSVLDEPTSPIYGMPIIEVLNSKNVVVLKRGMSSGYSGIENPLFFHDKTKMLFGDAKDSIEGILSEIKTMD
jgi:hypothetical protein